MDFEESVRYMDGLIRFGWKLGNERFEVLCARLGDPQKRYPVIHIAGTKGKGSTTALAAAILQQSGYTVGSYFSPYVYDVRERVQVNGEMIPREDFARLMTQVRPHVEALAETDFGQTTEFEIKTIVAFLYFAERGVDYACIEVGLGGRLDATNVVEPLVTVITNIGLDHTLILGDTHALIAAEKAGILKPRIPCITATDNAEALAVIQRIASERMVPLTYVRRSPQRGLESPASLSLKDGSEGDDAEGQGDTVMVIAGDNRFSILTPIFHYDNLQLCMGGKYQQLNAACAVAAVEKALALQGITLQAQAVQEALASTQLPGRLSVVKLEQGPVVVLDGAHNALAAAGLAESASALMEQYGTNRLLLVIGMLTGHAPDGVLAPLAPMAERVYVSQPNWKRAMPAEEVAAAARLFSHNVDVFPSVREAATRALADAEAGTLVLVTGSFYTVGEVPMETLAEWRSTALASECSTRRG